MTKAKAAAGTKSHSGKVPDKVVVEYRDAKGAVQTRTFTADNVNKENADHKGKNHLHLAKEFVANPDNRGAHIVSHVPAADPVAPAPAGDEPAA